MLSLEDIVRPQIQSNHDPSKDDPAGLQRQDGSDFAGDVLGGLAGAGGWIVDNTVGRIF